VAGRTYEAAFQVVDPEGDPLRFHWEVKPESDSIKKGGDFEERIPNVDGVLRNPTAATTTLAVQQPARTACSPTHSTATARAHAISVPGRAGCADAGAGGAAGGQVMAIAYSGYREGQHPNGTARARNWTWSREPDARAGP